MSNEALNYVWKNSKQRNSALVLMLKIADMSNDDGECYPGTARLAGDTGCRVTERQLQKLIDKCETDGELAVVENGGIETGHGKTNRYFILGLRYKKWQEVPGARQPRPKQGVSKTTPRKKSDGVSKTTPQGVSNLPSLGVSKTTPKPLVEPLVEPKDITPVVVIPDEPINLDDYFPPFDEVEAQQPKKFTFKDAVMLVWELQPLADGKNGLEVNFIGLLSGKGKKGSKWETYHLEDPATVEEVLAFGGWYSDKEPDRDKPPVTAEGIHDNFLLFRQSPEYSVWMEYGREQLKAHTTPAQPSEPEPAPQTRPSDAPIGDNPKFQELMKKAAERRKTMLRDDS
jgi:hypothetical protein